MSLPVLSQKLVLEAPERVSDGAGGFQQVWTALGTLWAEVTARSGRESATGGAPVSRVACRVVVRGAPVGAPQRPQPQQRFRHGTRIYAIQAVAESDAQGRYLTCYAEEETAV